MKKNYLLFEVTANSLEDALSVVERSLGQRMKAHDSSYRGGDYYRLHDVGQEHFILQRNFDGCELFEEKFPQSQFILYLNDAKRPDDLLRRLRAESSVRLLRHEEV